MSKATRRPSDLACLGVVRKRAKPVGVDALSGRYAAGLDLWTGVPLIGQAKREWEATMKRAGEERNEQEEEA